MLIIEAAGPYAAAIKPNLAFYEALGADGMAALERIRARIPAEIPVVIDAKRADIGSTAARQAVALFDRLGADAVTVNPYPGGEAIAPLLERDRPLRLRPVPDLEPRGGRVPEPGRRRRPGDRRSRRAAPPAGRAACRDVGPGRDGRPRRRRDGARRAPRDPGGGARSGLPGPGDRRPGRGHRAGPARRSGDRLAGRARQRGGACWSTSRAASATPPSVSPVPVNRATRGSVSRRPPVTGLRASLCYPSPRIPPGPDRAIRSDP